MASVANSTAAFRSFLVDIGLTPLIDRIFEQGWETYGDLGFACSDPSSASAVAKEIIDVLVGPEPEKV